MAQRPIVADLAINEMAADLLVLKVAVQAGLLPMLTRDPGAFSLFQDQVLAAIEAAPLAPEEAQGSQRRKALNRFRAERFFQEIRGAIPRRS